MFASESFAASGKFRTVCAVTLIRRWGAVWSASQVPVPYGTRGVGLDRGGDAPVKVRATLGMGGGTAGRVADSAK